MCLGSPHEAIGRPLMSPVALHYGINDVKGDRFQRVELKDSVRWGLLGKGAVLMAAAYPNRTSPVLRGAFILKHIQGVPPANPPPNVPTLDEKDIGTTKALTVREMMAKHRVQPDVLVVPRGHGSARPGAREFRRDRQVAGSRSVCRCRHRFVWRAAGRHAGQRPGRPAEGAAAPSRAVRADVHGGLADLRAPGANWSTRHADRAADRPRRGERQLPVLGAGPGRRSQRAVQDAPGAAQRRAPCERRTTATSKQS